MKTTKTKVLIVDDEVSLTCLLKSNLEQRCGYEVKTVNRARDAVAAARMFRPDFILLDVMMPDGDGGDIARDLEKVPECKGIPITFLTAAVRREELGAADGFVGGRSFIAKPVSLGELHTHIEKRLAQRRLVKK